MGIQEKGKAEFAVGAWLNVNEPELAEFTETFFPGLLPAFSSVTGVKCHLAVFIQLNDILVSSTAPQVEVRPGHRFAFCHVVHDLQYQGHRSRHNGEARLIRARPEVLFFYLRPEFTAKGYVLCGDIGVSR